jgi:hypothetical protein
MYFFWENAKIIKNAHFTYFLFFIGCSSLFLCSSFALPSLQSRDNNIGFRETGVKQTCLFAAFEAGYSGADRANFMRG